MEFYTIISKDEKPKKIPQREELTNIFIVNPKNKLLIKFEENLESKPITLNIAGFNNLIELKNKNNKVLELIFESKLIHDSN